MVSTWTFFVVPETRHDTVFRWGRALDPARHRDRDAGVDVRVNHAAHRPRRHRHALVGLVAGFFAGPLRGSSTSGASPCSCSTAPSRGARGADPTPATGTRGLRPMPYARSRTAARASRRATPWSPPWAPSAATTRRSSCTSRCATAALRVAAFEGVAYGFDAYGRRRAKMNRAGEHYVAFRARDQRSRRAARRQAVPAAQRRHRVARRRARRPRTCADGTRWARQ